MSDAALNAALFGLISGIASSLRPAFLMGIYRLCRLAPPRSRLRRVLVGGKGYYYGWIAAMVAVGSIIYAGFARPQ